MQTENIIKTFEDLNINSNLLKGVYLYGFKNPSIIQIKGIQAISTGKDCILQSQSGTGKTGTYLLGVLNKIDHNKKSCQIIVIVPTRELADQVVTVCQKFIKYTSINMASCIGGTNIKSNLYKLKKAHMIIGTTGRIEHMIKLKYLNLINLNTIVLDEADTMLSIGFKERIYDILKLISNDVQKCLLSATIPRIVHDISKTLMNDPIKVLLKREDITVKAIKQYYLDTEIEDYKFDILLDLYQLISTSQTIIFCNTIRKVKWIAENLEQKNFPITIIHGKMSQTERNETVNDFRTGKTRLLLTTDLLSRGIDIPQVNLVINYDIPYNKETYIHRIGRSGRFGKVGVAITFIKLEDEIDRKLFDKLKYYYKMDINELPENISDYLN